MIFRKLRIIFLFIFIIKVYPKIIYSPVSAPLVINVKDYGAKGDGKTDDWEVINRAVSDLKNKNGGILYFPEGIYIVKYAITLASNISYIGESKETTIIKADFTSLDNVFGNAYPLIHHWEQARKVNGNINRLTKPDFISQYTEEEAFNTGGMAGFSVVNVRIENLTVDGNKNNRQENKLNLIGKSSKKFLPGEKITSNKGATAIISGVFGASYGFSIEPRTIIGNFSKGDIVQGLESGARMLIEDKKADDAYQMLIRFDAVSHSIISNCILKNSIFTAISIYNYSNDNIISNNFLYDNNKLGTDYTYGSMNIFIEFDSLKNIIKSNKIDGGLGYSVFVQSTGGNNYDTQILFNTITNPGADGIRIGNENSNSLIINPFVYGNVVSGALTKGAVGIRIIHNGNGFVSGAIVKNNRVFNSDFGILLQGRVKNSYIVDNTVYKINNSKIASSSTLEDNVLKNNLNY